MAQVIEWDEPEEIPEEYRTIKISETKTVDEVKRTTLAEYKSQIAEINRQLLTLREKKKALVAEAKQVIEALGISVAI